MPSCLVTSALGGQYVSHLQTRDSGFDSCSSYKLQRSIAWHLPYSFLFTKIAINDEIEPKQKLCTERHSSAWLLKLSCP